MTLSYPVYIGDYWATLLQTKNCWNMLNFLRPRARTDRNLRVDTVYIDQANLVEPATQVGEMGLMD